MKKSGISLLAAALGCLWLLLAVMSSPLQAGIPPALEEPRSKLFEGRKYLVGFPNDPLVTRRRLRDLYLGATPDGDYTLASGRFSFLQAAVAGVVRFRNGGTPATPADLDLAQRIAWESLEAELQGQLITGNFNLLKGLRVAFPPSPGSGGERPTGEDQLPVGAPAPDPSTPASEKETNGGYLGARITDLAYAKEHFARGIISVLEFMASDPSGAIRSTDPLNNLGGQFPQYTRFNRPGDLADLRFGDPTDGGADDKDIQTAQTTGYLLGNLLDRYGKAIAGIGDRLWKAAYFEAKRNPGQPRAQERAELLNAAQAELRKNAQFQYLACLPIAATMKDSADYAGRSEFETCRIDQARVSSNDCIVTMEHIRRGDVPKLDSFELNASTTDINNQINLVKALAVDAKNKYATAKDAIWKARTAETATIAAAQQMRAQFTDQLADLSGLDPGTENSEPYRGLTVEAGRKLYQQHLYSHVGTALQADGTSSQLTDGSELGRSIIAYRRALAAVQSARNRVDDIPQRIKVIEDREGAINGITMGTENEISAYRLSIAKSEAVTVTVSANAGFSFGTPGGPFVGGGVSSTYTPGRITAAEFQNQIGYAEAVKQTRINNTNAEAEIRSLLLQQHQYELEMQESVLQAQYDFAGVRAVLSRIDRLIEDHLYYQSGNNRMWFSDPALMFEREKEELDYDQAETEYVRELYVLSQVLGVRWAEPFENPPVNRLGAAVTLGGGNYDAWCQPESIFNAVNVAEADTFLNCLQDWDKFLRNERNGGDANNHVDVVVSLRQDIKQWSDVVWDGSQFTIDPKLKRDNIKRFQEWLLSCANPAHPSWSPDYQARVEFALIHGQSTRTRQGPLATQPSIVEELTSEWNLRLTSLRMHIIGSSRVTQINPYKLELYQYGRIETPRYPRNGIKLIRSLDLTSYYADPMEGSNSPYRYAIYAGVGASSTPPATPDNLVESEPSPFCNRWILQIENPGVGPIALQNIEDIELIMQIRSGRPPEFAW